MEQLIHLLTTASSDDFIGFFLKAFAVLFAFLYLIYAIVISKQTQIMNSTFKTKMSSVLSAVAFLQILFAGILILASLFLI